MYHATIVTLFPNLFPGTLSDSIPKKALEKGVWKMDTVDIREFAQDKHKTVDDKPFGGGAGMVLRPDVVHEAMQHAYSLGEKRKILYMSPRGKTLSQKMLHEHVKSHPEGSIILCGRYEGIDQRVIDYWQKEHDLEEVSVGDYILSGGELPAQLYLDAIVRLLPDALGSSESSKEESFELDLLEFFHYTRPGTWNGISVPDVLLSGHHENIQKWRHEQSKEITKKRRPDIWEDFTNK